MVRPEDVRDWIQGVRDQGAARLELRAKVDRALVRAWRLTNNDNGRAGDLDTIAAQVIKAAEHDGLAQATSRAAYWLLSFVTDDEESERHQARLPVVVPGGTPDTAKGTDEGPPSLQGVVAQQMRQIGELHHLLIRSQEGRADGYERMIAQLTGELQSYRTKHIELLDLFEKVSSMKVEREHDAKRVELEQKRQEFVASKLDMLVPVLLNRLMGGGPGKGTPFFGEEILKRLLSSLKEPQMEALMTGHPVPWEQDQTMLMAELYLAYGEREKRQGQQRTLNGSAAEQDGTRNKTEGTQS